MKLLTGKAHPELCGIWRHMVYVAVHRMVEGPDTGC